MGNHMSRANANTGLLLLSGLSFLAFLYLMFTAMLPHYGYFIDELYYIACARHLAFGYIDHPPLSIVLLALSRGLFGDSLPALRLFPALATAANVFMTGMIARRLGGDLRAIVIAALAAIAMPVYMIMGGFYSMNAFEPLIWTAIIYLVIRLVQDDNPKVWLLIGLMMGLGLEMKHTMGVYAVALLAGMLITPVRRFVWSRWFFGGMGIAVLLLVPNMLWQYVNGFPSLEFYRNAMVNKNVPTGPVGVLLGQVLFANPLSLPLWIAGLWWLLFTSEGGKYRFFGLAYLVLFGVMVVSQASRPDRIGAIYTVLFAAGAVAIERLRRPAVRRAAAGLIILLCLCGAALVAPIATPLLSPPVLKQYLSAIGYSYSIEKGKMGEPIPQWLADRLGWKELVSAVAEVYRSLPPDEQRNAVIVSNNYGGAGALELYGPALGLPRVYSTHNSYHLWGPPSDSVKTYVGVMISRRDLEGHFESVEEAAVLTCADCTRPQRRVPIYVARGPKFSIEKEWPGFKIYD
jgi:hypothetical protein